MVCAKYMVWFVTAPAIPVRRAPRSQYGCGHTIDSFLPLLPGSRLASHRPKRRVWQHAAVKPGNRVPRFRKEPRQQYQRDQRPDHRLAHDSPAVCDWHRGPHQWYPIGVDQPDAPQQQTQGNKDLRDEVIVCGVETAHRPIGRDLHRARHRRMGGKILNRQRRARARTQGAVGWPGEHDRVRPAHPACAQHGT